MKVAILTRHAIINYGSLLQTYALQKAVQSLGHECIVLDYIREDENFKNREKTILERKPNWSDSLTRRTFYLMLRQPESYLSGWRFQYFRKKMLNLSQLYQSIDDLRSGIIGADVYMTGSDQVWGFCEDGKIDETYFFPFLESGCRIVSYGSSFGRSNLEESEKAEVRAWLSRYDNITVREDSAIEILKDISIDSKQVVDPTLLLDKDLWGQFTEKLKDNYILVYQLHNNILMDEYAKRIAANYHIKLIRVSPTFHQILRGGHFKWCPDVSRFLSFIRNARCLITDSFHGTAFAINFNIPFIEVLPTNNTKSRNQSILKLTGLEDRVLEDFEDFSLFSKKIDYEKVNGILKTKRQESINELKHLIEG